MTELPPPGPAAPSPWGLVPSEPPRRTRGGARVAVAAAVVGVVVVGLAGIWLLAGDDDGTTRSVDATDGEPAITSTDPSANTVGESPDAPVDDTVALEVRWQTPASGFGGYDELARTSIVAATDELLVLASANANGAYRLMVLDRETGQERWAASPTLDEFREVPFVHLAGDVLVYSEYGELAEGTIDDDVGRLIGADVLTGDEIWRHEWLLSHRSWVPAGDALVLHTTTGSEERVIAISPSTGDELWSAPTTDPVVEILALRAGGIVVGQWSRAGGPGQVIGLDIEGAERWRRDDLEVRRESIPDLAPTGTSEVVALDVEGALVGVSVSTGESAWTSPLPEAFAEFEDDEVVVVTDPDADLVVACGTAGDEPTFLHVVDVESGDVTWSRAISDDILYGGSFYGFADQAIVVSAADNTRGCWRVEFGSDSQLTSAEVIDRGGLQIWATDIRGIRATTAPLSAWSSSPSIARIETITDASPAEEPTYDAATGTKLFDQADAEDDFEIGLYGSTLVGVRTWPSFEAYLVDDPTIRFELGGEGRVIEFLDGILYVLTDRQIVALD